MHRVYLLENTVQISDEVRDALFKLQATWHEDEGCFYTERWETAADMVEDGRLYFNIDDFEHMDWLSEQQYRDVLKQHHVEGMVTFIDPQRVPRIWGYYFDGEGGCIELQGKIVYEDLP